jgi:squalene-hopene/tetraprenyl-beta-curcumene cyclase
MVRPALEFLLARQHPDGGWGETPDAYLDPASAGAAPSNATLTGWVLPGLLPWLGAQHAAAKRAVHYLLTTQLPDGDWPQGNHVHMYLVPDRAYRLPASALMHPLEALASWRRAGG